MGAVKVTNFMGVAPKIAPELLPDTAAQIARNAKLYAGDLIPYPQPVVVGNTLRSGIIRTLYALREPDTGALKWLSWNSNVDIVVATADEYNDQRFFYTGDGVPKVSNYELAIGGPAPYPYRWYDLGLPLPADDFVVTTVASPAITSSSVSYARDNASLATIITQAPHELRSGQSITISGFTVRTGTYSQSGSTITVTINAHGLQVGGSVTLNFTSDNAIDGTFTVTSVLGPNTFLVTAVNSASPSGNVEWDIRGFNATNAEVTVIDDTTFTYFSPGAEIAVTANVNGRIALAGNTQERTYVFTYLTPWLEESIASEPSDELYIKEGQTVTVTALPVNKPSGNNFIRGVRLYRTLPSATETEYYRLQTLWFPVALDTVARTDNLTSIKTFYPHNLDIDDRFKLAYCSDVTFEGEFIVIDVPDQYTVQYEQILADVAEVAATGFIYHDVSENPPETTARFWGYDTYAFTDDFDSTALTEILETDEYDIPPEGLQGLVTMQNNILVGYVANELFFSEPNRPHAWPRDYNIVLEHNVVGLSVMTGGLIVLTDGYPYIVSGADPAAGMSVQKVDAFFPCLNGRGIVKMTNAVAYPTHDGIAVYTPYGGAQLITKLNYNDDTWKLPFDPATLIATLYGEAYFGSYGTEAQAPGAVVEPTPPAVAIPTEPPAPIDSVPGAGGGGTGGEGEGGGGGVPLPADTLYDGTIITSKWYVGDRDTYWGYTAPGVTSSPEQGTRYPLMFEDGVRYLAQAALRITIFRGYIYRMNISIRGYTANPSGNAALMPVSFKIGAITKSASSRDNYNYQSSTGTATWTWYGDKFNLKDVIGSTLAITIKRAP